MQQNEVRHSDVGVSMLNLTDVSDSSSTFNGVIPVGVKRGDP